MRFKLFTLLFIMFFTKILFAKTPQTYALHINGINVTKEEAKENKRLLKDSSNIQKFNYSLIYNPTRTPDEWEWLAKIKGAIDVWKQKWYEERLLPTLDEFTQEVMKAQGYNFPIDSDEYKQFKSMLSQQFEDLILDKGGKNMQEVISEFHDIVPIQFADVLQLLKNEGRDYSKSKDYVILLPHSQGNLYANNLYTFLTQIEHYDSSRITIFGFASPAEKELGQMQCNKSIQNYATSTNDGVIELARTYFSRNILSSNVVISRKKEDASGHSLTDIYLDDDYTKFKYNSFMFITYNNCFKDLNKIEPLGRLPNMGAKIVYNKKHNSLFQINQRNFCSYDLSLNNQWNCDKTINVNNIIASSLTTDGEDNIYFISMADGSKLYGMNLINNTTTSHSIEHYYVDAFTFYKDGWFYYINSHDLIKVNPVSGKSASQKIFSNIPAGLTFTSFDSKDNLYIAPVDTTDYRKMAQVYYQNLGNESSVYLFGKPTDDRVIFNSTINKDNIFLCSTSKIYYAPLDLLNNTEWSTIDMGCNKIISGNNAIFFTTWDGSLYKYEF